MRNRELRFVALVFVWAVGWSFLVGSQCSTPYGVVGSPRGVPNAYTSAKSAGFVMVKGGFEWDKLEPNQNDFNHWTDVTIGPDQFAGVGGLDSADGIVQAAHDAGLLIGITITKVPLWARPGSGSNDEHIPTNTSSIFNFAQQAAARYCGRVSFWEAFTEANIGGAINNGLDGSGNPILVSPASYRSLIASFYDGIKAGCPDVAVIEPGIFCNASDACTATAINPWVKDASGFIRAFTDISIHTYGPESSQKTRLNEANTYVANSQGQANAPSGLFVTEFGISTCTDGDQQSCSDSVTGSPPGPVILDYYDACKAASFCNMAFFFTLHDRWTKNGPSQIRCDYGLIRGVAGTGGANIGDPRSKMCRLRDAWNPSGVLACDEDVNACSNP